MRLSGGYSLSQGGWRWNEGLLRVRDGGESDSAGHSVTITRPIPGSRYWGGGLTIGRMKDTGWRHAGTPEHGRSRRRPAKPFGWGHSIGGRLEYENHHPPDVRGRRGADQWRRVLMLSRRRACRFSSLRKTSAISSPDSYRVFLAEFWVFSSWVMR